MTWNAGSHSRRRSGMESCRPPCMSRRTVSRRHTVGTVSTYPARCLDTRSDRLAMSIRSNGVQKQSAEANLQISPLLSPGDL
jgi:hypothetical protein